MRTAKKTMKQGQVVTRRGDNTHTRFVVVEDRDGLVVTGRVSHVDGHIHALPAVMRDEIRLAARGEQPTLVN